MDHNSINKVKSLRKCLFIELGNKAPRLCTSLTFGERAAPRQGGFMVGFLNEDPNKVRNHAAIKSDIANFIKRGFAGKTTTPSDEQREFFTELNQLANSKINRHVYEVPETLLDFETPISLERISEGITQTLTTQNVRTIKTDTDLMAQECTSYLVGRKELENILDHYKPLENRSSQVEPIDGQEAKFFSANFERLTKLDTEVLEIQRQIEEAKAQKKAQLGQLEEEHVVLREKLEKNGEKVTELQGEMSAVNKLTTGMGMVESVFTKQQVSLELDDPINFLEKHFDLGTIIQSDVSASATLTFTPPEFYEVEKDMQSQFIHMHGLDETAERRAEQSFDKAADVVRQSAAIVQERECLVVSPVLEHRQEIELVDQVRSDRDVELTTTFREKLGQIIDRNEGVVVTRPTVEQDKAPTLIEQLAQTMDGEEVVMTQPTEEHDKTTVFREQLGHIIAGDEEVVMTQPVEAPTSLKDKLIQMKNDEETIPTVQITND